jgi:hypothetical protein
MVVAEATDVVFASADEATTPIEASDNASASNFFIFLSPFFPFTKKISQAPPRYIHNASAGELDSTC